MLRVFLNQKFYYLVNYITTMNTLGHLCSADTYSRVAANAHDASNVLPSG